MNEIKSCSVCGGAGRKMYGNTATWHKDCVISGQAFLADICDKCWGSGDEKAPWLNLYEWGQHLRAPSPAVARLVEAAREILAGYDEYSWKELRAALKAVEESQ